MNVASNNIKTKKPGKTTAFFICLLVAAFLWLVRALNTTYVYSLKIPVEFRNIPQNRKPLTNLPDRLNVEVKASGLKLILILLSRPFQPLLIDINDLKSVNKNTSFILSEGAVKLRPSIHFDAQIKQISPDTLYFAEKSGFSKTVPVKAVINIKYSPGFAGKTPVYSPAFINITGDSNAVKAVDTLYTQPVQLTNVSGSVHKQMDIIKPTNRIFLDNSRIDVKVEVDRLSEQKIVVPVEANLPAGSYKSIHIYPAKAEIKYTVLQGNQKDVDASMFKAVIDLKHQRSNSKAPVVLTTVPGDINIISISPQEVEYLLIKK